MEDEEQSSHQFQVHSLKLRAKERKPQGFAGPPKETLLFPTLIFDANSFFGERGGCSKTQANYVIYDILWP